jgi:hypothetical protein
MAHKTSSNCALVGVATTQDVRSIARDSTTVAGRQLIDDGAGDDELQRSVEDGCVAMRLVRIAHT